MNLIQIKLGRFWILAVLCIGQFGPVPTTGFSTESSSTTGAPANVSDSKGETGSVLVAAGKHRKRRRQVRKRAPKRNRRGGRRNMRGRRAPVGGRSLAKTAIKGVVGIVSGIEGVDDTVFTFGGDYVMPLGRNLNLQAGLTYWFHDIVEELFAVRISVLAPGAGVGYLIPVGPKMWVEGSGKAVFASFSSTTTTDDGTGKLTETSSSDSSLGLVLGGGFHYDIGGMAVGPEIQYPIYFDEKLKDATAINILFFLEFQL